MTRVEGTVTWRAWLGRGTADVMDQVGVAEFDTEAAARAWLEQELPIARGRTAVGERVFGSVDRGTYRAGRDAVPTWEPDCEPAGMLDADLVDDVIVWRHPRPCPDSVESASRKQLR